jgi:hypothetical protein
MAYPTVSAPYGLKPVNLIGGQVFAGATRQIPITTSSVNYNTAIFNGDVVQITTSGCVIISTLAAQTTVTVNGVIGVFLGCSYTNPSTKQKTFAQYWPGFSSGVTDAVAYVCEDPDAVFQVASVSSGSTIAFYGQTIIGNNVSLILNSGSTTTGDSAIAIDGTSAVTTLLPMRVIAGVPDTANSSGNFCEFLVKFNFGYHSYYNQTGV